MKNSRGCVPLLGAPARARQGQKASSRSNIHAGCPEQTESRGLRGILKIIGPAHIEEDNTEVTRQFLTLRDKHAHTLEDLFDFEGSPSLNTPITPAALPAQDCTPK